MAVCTNFFLGVNNAAGFYSLFDELRDTEAITDFLILKGGPGVGKSTMMKYIAAQGAQKGFDIEYIRCSGDPDSYDVVRFPQYGILIADGTAPHVMEPMYPAAVDRYVNLGRFYDIERLKERRREIIACTDGYKREYQKAYASLRAARAVTREMEGEMQALWNGEKCEKRLQNIWKRERGHSLGKRARTTRRFLGGLTTKGRVNCEETLYTLCDHIYELDDSFHLAAAGLQRLADQIVQEGCDVILCPDPDAPERLAHVLVPELHLGFVTTNRAFRLTRIPYRRLRVDQMLEQEALHERRQELKLKGKLAEALEAEAIDHLRLAGEKHDELELIYHPFVNFDGVMALAEEESRRIFSRI